ncbi:carbon storage regulator CsrA [Paenibacillus harenae]|uniref:Translational regulator CsrA n=1 Tax=Paenibacillus harenae TaxID=306543 RepID=A0ABT9UA68_PAEHA|nr:carbon storage regulator CsrA [Paenibacillus harenae]MDQ0116556.1 carbon storage regulator [Paenibacillus harenae]
MLILSRKRGQSILINNDIEIIITGIEGDQVKLGIVAPREMKVIRKEIADDVRVTNTQSVSAEADFESLKKWSKNARLK